MRIAPLIAVTAVALALTACTPAGEAAADGVATEAAEASGVAEDLPMTAEDSAAAAASAANAPHSAPAPGQ